jgi:UDP-N-acetylmuramoylalanine-D-glutamate ligase
MIFPKDFKGKKILIYGFGKTGKSVHYFLNRNKINHFIWDDDLISKKKKF